MSTVNSLCQLENLRLTTTPTLPLAAIIQFEQLQALGKLAKR
ncbi:MAG: hypothetical protein ACI9EB_000883 [Pseudomonas sp.]|jgi:hypothetical protein